ncbi:hypothetical protein FGO68_gene17118 [Halteria grandinella]|uniref:Signal recognition particle 54 kDa protein n=1 Tax=Halteria grandinella TaxID=5974 RepID=A0A8J8NUC1_HALGN|nr:hypothetical protein FGO68_gene17118 [Halteria grandinella]
MVLAELGQKIGQALKKLNAASVIDDKLLQEILTEIASALLSADVNIKYVIKLRDSVKTQVTLQMNSDGQSANGVATVRKLIQRTVVEELTAMLQPAENRPYEFKKGKANVVMLVGLQGSGKTTTCTKFAYHYMKKGWRVGLVCADTFRAGAFEQLKMNAAKIKCPFFGHKKETDPVKIAEEGVNFFKKEKFEIIIVDTSGRHKQEAALFEEMQQVQQTIKPDTAIFVMDSSIGQACYDQAQAFNKTIRVGSVIITKLDGHAKGGGALSAVAATQSPVVFIGTGEHFDDLEPFEAEGFIKRLLGLGDLSGLMKTVKEAISEEKQKNMIENLQKGQFRLRDMRDQFQSVLNMGPLSQVVGMIPGLNANLIPKGKEKEGTDRVKRFLYMMDSMTEEELDCVKPLTESRIARVAQGSGTRVEEVNFLLEEYKKFEKMVSKMGKMSNLAGKKPADLEAMKKNPQLAMQQMQKAMDPGMLKQMGGMGNIMNMVKQMGGMEGMQDMMQQMMGGAGGAGGAGGMPNLGALAGMLGGGGGAGMMGAPPKMPPGMMKRRR